MKIKFLIVLGILWAFTSSAKKYQTDYEVFAADPAFNVSEVPEKWKNESAVILAKKTYQYYPESKNTQGLKIESVRYRIKIQDKAAADFFASFYYRQFNGSEVKSKWEDSIRIVLIKHDGKETTISTENALEAEAKDVPDFFLSKYESARKYRKVAIPGIEPGDILDFAYLNNQYYFNYWGINYPIVYELLQYEYPVIYQQFNFKIHDEKFVNAISMNGAPSLTKMESDEKHMVWYQITDKNRDAEKGTRWLYELRDLPAFKFLVVVPGDKFEIHSDKPGEVMDRLPLSVLKKKIASRIQWSVSYYLIAREVNDRIREFHKDVTDKNELSKLIYYYTRQTLYADLQYDYRNTDYNKRSTDQSFCSIMKNLCEKYDIPFEVELTTTRGYCEIRDVFKLDELIFFVKMNNQIVLPLVSPWSKPDDRLSALEGMEYISIDLDKKDKDQDTTIHVLPVTTAKDNLFKFDLGVKFNPEMDMTNIDRTGTARGIARSGFSSEVLLHYLWSESDNSTFGGHSPEAKRSYAATAKAEKARQKDEWENSQRKAFLEQAKDRLKEDFADLDSLYESVIVKDGRGVDNPDLIVRDKFTVNNHLKKVGQNYSFDLGSLIGEQVDLSEKEKERTNNIWFAYARTLETNIVLTIPEGYTVKGIESLNMNVDNSTGSFTSKATVNGNELSVHVAKIYKGNYFPVSDWSKVVDFVDAAYKFSQAKVILAKK